MAVEEKNVEVSVTTISGEPLATLNVEPGATVSKVKEHFEEHFGYPTACQQLLLQGTIAEDNDVLDALAQPLAFTLVLVAFNKAEALHDAAERGHQAAVRKLLFHVALDRQETADMLVATNGQHGGRTALHAAALKGHSSVCRALLEADHVPSTSWPPQEKDLEDTLAAACKDNLPALHDAASNGHDEICKALLEAAPNLRVRREMLAAKFDGGNRALHVAATKGHDMACRALLAAAPNLEVRRAMLLAKGCAGSTALHQAASLGWEETCRALQEVAKDMEVHSEMLTSMDEEGRTAAEVAADVCRPLLESEAGG